ncbi:hypothetical protein EXIGLDRAFT_771999 [Exidia glandulosa HHB12029]|uniref:Uncharacterized protein n=1 Tax=Exidia glandulosa HHB12029 TaxID=1314781 RepID=A0A165FM09_EXIGL|nr:hypothetical protein EXIGLDRAFT_771999 [Exidia glandulosa HHB12029]
MARSANSENDASQVRAPKAVRRWYVAQYVDAATQTDLASSARTATSAQMNRTCSVVDFGRQAAANPSSRTFVSAATSTPSIPKIRVNMYDDVRDGLAPSITAATIIVTPGVHSDSRRTLAQHLTAAPPHASSTGTETLRTLPLDAVMRLPDAATDAHGNITMDGASGSKPALSTPRAPVNDSSTSRTIALSSTQSGLFSTDGHVLPGSNTAVEQHFALVGVSKTLSVPIQVDIRSEGPPHVSTPRLSSRLPITASPSQLLPDTSPTATVHPQSAPSQAARSSPTSPAPTYTAPVELVQEGNGVFCGPSQEGASLATLSKGALESAGVRSSSVQQPIDTTTSGASVLDAQGDILARAGLDALAMGHAVPSATPQSQSQPVQMLDSYLFKFVRMHNGVFLVRSCTADLLAHASASGVDSLRTWPISAPGVAPLGSTAGSSGASNKIPGDALLGTVGMKVEPLDDDLLPGRPLLDDVVAKQAELYRHSTQYLAERRAEEWSRMKRAPGSSAWPDAEVEDAGFDPTNRARDDSDGFPGSLPLHSYACGYHFHGPHFPYLRFRHPIGLSVWLKGRREPMFSLTPCDISEIRVR